MDANGRGLDAQGVLYRFVGAFVDELAKCGVRNACLCPGSRSSPLALLLHGHPGIKTWVLIDERSGGFFGLGMAKALREPVALVCTSGTAALNFSPAVVEAHYARAPLLVLTADRPPELRGSGANQTIDQTRLFGVYAKASIDVPLPEASEEILRYVRTLACRAKAIACTKPFGVVHLNFPFREPLVPIDPGLSAKIGQREADRPYVSVFQSDERPSQDALKGFAAKLTKVRKGLIVCGPQDDPGFPSAVIGFAEALCFPILCDPLSGVRSMGLTSPLTIDTYDALLRHKRTALSLTPDFVLRFGATPTSKALLDYLKNLKDARQVLVDGGEGLSDPCFRASAVLKAHPRWLLEGLSPILGQGAQLKDFSRRWVHAALIARNALIGALEAKGGLSEPWVLHALPKALPEGTTLFIGNSMPVRDLDAFFFSMPKRLRFLANRGASGIDGVVSCALGAAGALKVPVVSVMGDLSFYHDMNGLLAAKLHGLQGTIVLLNNDGGGIFSFLPQAKEADAFNELFGTPHGLNFRHAASLYGLTYHRAISQEDFLGFLGGSLKAKGVSLLEVPSDRQENVSIHKRLFLAVETALENNRS